MDTSDAALNNHVFSLKAKGGSSNSENINHPLCSPDMNIFSKYTSHAVHVNFIVLGKSFGHYLAMQESLENYDWSALFCGYRFFIFVVGILSKLRGHLGNMCISMSDNKGFKN